MSRWYVLAFFLSSLFSFPFSFSSFSSFSLSHCRSPSSRYLADWKVTNNQLFFDDEHRNFEVESLGVTMCLVEPRGTDLKLFKEGLGMWRKRRGLKVEQD
jgi:hypothetical protein